MPKSRSSASIAVGAKRTQSTLGFQVAKKQRTLENIGKVDESVKLKTSTERSLSSSELRLRKSDTSSSSVVTVSVAVPKAPIDPEQREKDLHVLRLFDFNADFGPCVGVTRLQRWERAEKFGDNPPQEIKDLLNKYKDDEEYQHSTWRKYHF